MKNRMLNLLEKSILTTTTPRHRIIPVQHAASVLPRSMLLQHHAAASISSSTSSLEQQMKVKSKSTNNNMEWRKRQLDLLKQKFHPHKGATSAATTPNLVSHEEDDEEENENGQYHSAETTTADAMIQHDDDLQPTWKEMESRVKNRRTRSLEENQGRLGRENVKKTDEEEWLRAGLYTNNNNNGSDGDDDTTSTATTTSTSNGVAAAAKSDR
jgi:hypothetical protein